MFKNLLNHMWRKPQPVQVNKEKERVDLSKLENHFVISVGVQHCDLCNKETMNCCKIDIADQCVCICPRKDIKGFRRPAHNDK